MKSRPATTLALYVALFLLAILYALPLIWTVATSLKPLEDVYRFPPTLAIAEIQPINYIDVFRTLPFARFLFNSLVISLSAVTGAVLTSSMAGYALARLPWKGKAYWFALLIASMMLPAQILLVPHFLTYQWLGWVDTYKPLIVPAWLGGGAFNIFLFRQFFRTIPRDVEEAALLDGATRWQCYWHVLLPIARPAVVTVAMLSFVYHWRSFMNPLIYLSDFQTFPVSLGLRMYQTLAGTWINQLMAASLIAVVPTILVMAIGQHWIMASRSH